MLNNEGRKIKCIKLKALFFNIHCDKDMSNGFYSCAITFIIKDGGSIK